MSIQQFQSSIQPCVKATRELTQLLSQCHKPDPKNRAKDAPLSPISQKIMVLLHTLFYNEMVIFAYRLCHNEVDARDLVQDALTSFISKGKFQAFDPSEAGVSGVVGWYRKVYRNDIRDLVGKLIRYQSRHISIDGNWWEANEENNWQ